MDSFDPGMLPRAADPALVCGDRVLDLGRPRVMGILNVTPDSFSDGGRHASVGAARDRAFAMVDEGAALIDVGAESTRPGATPVDPAEEWRRLGPVLGALRDLPVPVSVDTRHAPTMARALDAGAAMINDVAGFRDEAAIAAIAASRCGLCVMHMRGDPGTMQLQPAYSDVVDEVAGFLSGRVARLAEAGIGRDRIVVDPGFGFGKTLEHNAALMRRLDRLVAIAPVLVGLSRKGGLGAITGRDVTDRLPASIAAALMAVERGARIVRAHDVAATVDALAIWSVFHQGPFP